MRLSTAHYTASAVLEAGLVGLPVLVVALIRVVVAAAGRRRRVRFGHPKTTDPIDSIIERVNPLLRWYKIYFRSRCLGHSIWGNCNGCKYNLLSISQGWYGQTEATKPSDNSAQFFFKLIAGVSDLRT